MLYRIRYYLSNNALRSLYYSLTYSHLQYAIGVWGGAGKTALNRLEMTLRVACEGAKFWSIFGL